MKKSTKILLIVFAVLTIAVIVTAIVMLKAVLGDDLFYMDTKRGSFYAASYRWVCLAGGILILFWIIIGVKRIRKRKGSSNELNKG